MPDLVYNVKFQIDDTSLQKVSQTTTSVTGGTSGNAQKDADKTKKSVRQLINEYSLLGKEADNVTRKLKSTSSGFTQFSSSTDATAQKLEGLKSELVPVIASLEGIANSTEATVQEQLKARTALSQLIGIYDRAGNATQAYVANQRMAAETMEMVGNETRRMNASFSTANQVLFSFSDGVQDASQFSYGFASGMRAIGNNIGFTGELFANLNRRVQEYNQTHGPNATSVTQELRNSLRGPAGILLGLNLAITAFTVVSREIEKYRKRAEEAKPPTVELSREVEKLASALDSLGVFGDDFLGVARTRFELGQLDVRIAQLQETVFTQEDQERLNTLLAQRRDIEEAVGARTSAQAETLFAQIDSEIELLRQKRNIANLEGASQSELEELQKRRNDLQKEFNELTSVSGNQLVSAAMIQKDMLAFEEEMSDFLKEETKIRQEQIDVVDQRRIDSLQTFSDRVIDFEQFLTDTMSDTNDLISDLVIENEQASVDSIIEIRRIEAQFYDEMERRKLNAYKQRTDAELNMETRAAAAKMNAYAQLASGIFAIGSEIFGQNKAIATAETIISTYFSAQKAYASTIAIPGVGPFAAQAAAAAAIAQGIARVIAIQKTEIGSTSVSSATSSTPSRGFGFQMNQIEGPQTFRTPAFTPTNGSMQPRIVINQELKADRKQLYILNKMGEEEYRQIKV